jgi:hypothetical protein
MGTLRNDRAYIAKRDALKRQCIKTGAVCHLCKKPFDFSLDYKHPMAFTADHLDPVGLGGSMTGPLKPAHRSCNSRRQMKPLSQVTSVEAPKTSRKW